MQGKTVAALESELSSRELSEWLAFARLYGLPDLFWIGGLIVQLVARAAGWKRCEMRDYVPYLAAAAPPPRENTPDENRAIFEAQMAALRRNPGG